MRLNKFEIILIGIGLIALFLALPYPYQPLNLIIGIPLLLIITIASFKMAPHIPLNCFGFYPAQRVRKIDLLKDLARGLALGLIIILVMRFGLVYMEPKVMERLERDATIPLWKWLIILFHAPVLEEIMYRLFCLTLIAWLMAKIKSRTNQKGLSQSALITANLLAAFLFALIHLPGWYQAGNVTFLLLTMVIGINMIAGFVFGHIYIQRGIELAILAHLGADIAVHLGGRLLLFWT